MATENSAITWRFLLPLAKRWSEDFLNERLPGDHPFVEELRILDATCQGVRLFLEPYSDNLSFEREAVVRFCHDILIQNIHEQHKPGSAWMDDRTYSSYHQCCQLPMVAVPALSIAHTDSEPSPMAQGISCALRTEYSSHSSDSALPQGVKRTQSSGSRSNPNRYIPASRRYPAPLTAPVLYENLKKKVTCPNLRKVLEDVFDLLSEQCILITFDSVTILVECAISSCDYCFQGPLPHCKATANVIPSATITQIFQIRTGDWCRSFCKVNNLSGANDCTGQSQILMALIF
jgi:hypothetical protein